MVSNRISMVEQERKTPRGQLKALWRNSMELANAGSCLIVIDERKGDLHEEVDREKNEADKLAAETGIYPDARVLQFLKRFAWATDLLLPSRARDTC